MTELEMIFVCTGALFIFLLIGVIFATIRDLQEQICNLKFLVNDRTKIEVIAEREHFSPYGHGFIRTVFPLELAVRLLASELGVDFDLDPGRSSSLKLVKKTAAKAKGK